MGVFQSLVSVKLMLQELLLFYSRHLRQLLISSCCGWKITGHFTCRYFNQQKNNPDMNIYLTGPLQGLGFDGRDQMARARYNLPSRGHAVTSALDFHQESEHPDVLRIAIGDRLSRVITSDQIVTMDNCEMDEICKIELQLARLLNIKVVPFLKFKKKKKRN